MKRTTFGCKPKFFYKLALLFLIIIGPAIVLGYFRPYASDESIFLYQGKILNEGRMPYIDSWDHKGPLLYILNALAINIPLSNSLGIPILQSSLLFGALTYIGICSGILTSNNKSIFIIFATVTSLTIYLGIHSFNTTELWCLPIQLITYFKLIFYFSTVKEKTIHEKYLSRFSMWLGFALVFTILIRPNNSFGIVFVIILLVSHLRKVTLNLFISFIVGISLPLILVSLYMNPIDQNLAKEFFDQYILYNVDYSSGLSFRQKLYGFGYLFLNYVKLPIMIFLLFLIILNFKKVSSFSTKICFSLIVVDFFSQTTSGRGYSSYLVGTFASVLIFIFFFLINHRNLKINLKLSVALATIVFINAIDVQGFSQRWHSNYKEQILASDYLKKQTTVADEILYLGANPYILVRSNRFSSSKFIYSYPLLSNFYRDRVALEENFSADFLSNPPNYVVQSDTGSCSLLSDSCYDGNSQYLSESLVFPEVRQYILSNYINVATVGGEIFYKKRNP